MDNTIPDWDEFMISQNEELSEGGGRASEALQRMLAQDAVVLSEAYDRMGDIPDFSVFLQQYKDLGYPLEISNIKLIPSLPDPSFLKTFSQLHTYSRTEYLSEKDQQMEFLINVMENGEFLDRLQYRDEKGNFVVNYLVELVRPDLQDEDDLHVCLLPTFVSAPDGKITLPQNMDIMSVPLTQVLDLVFGGTRYCFCKCDTSFRK